MSIYEEKIFSVSSVLIIEEKFLEVEKEKFFTKEGSAYECILTKNRHFERREKISVIFRSGTGNSFLTVQSVFSSGTSNRILRINFAKFDF